MRWQAAAAGALLVGLAVIAVIGFRGSDDRPTVAASAAPSPTVSASPSPSLSPSPSPSPEPVLPENDVDDPLEAIVAIEAYRDWLFENPDPDLVRFIYHDSCGCRRPLEAALENLEAAAERILLMGEPRITGLAAEPGDVDRVVWVDYDVLLPAAQQVGADGTVIDEMAAAREPIHRRAQLLREPNGRWVVLWLEDTSS